MIVTIEAILLTRCVKSTSDENPTGLRRFQLTHKFSIWEKNQTTFTFPFASPRLPLGNKWEIKVPDRALRHSAACTSFHTKSPAVCWSCLQLSLLFSTAEQARQGDVRLLSSSDQCHYPWFSLYIPTISLCSLPILNCDAPVTTGELHPQSEFSKETNNSCSYHALPMSVAMAWVLMLVSDNFFFKSKYW